MSKFNMFMDPVFNTITSKGVGRLVGQCVACHDPHPGSRFSYLEHSKANKSGLRNPEMRMGTSLEKS